MLQADRTGLSTAHAKALLTGIWLTTNSGKGFQAALEEKGWVLARGDRRDFVAIDPTGGVHSVARRIDGAKAADVRARFADIDPRDLQSVAETTRAQRIRSGARDREGSVTPQLKPQSGGKTGGSRERNLPLGGAAVVASKVAGSVLSAFMGEKPAPKVKKSDAAAAASDTTPSPRRQELMRQLSREIPQETERDAEIEADRGRDRTRR
jgi:hypothetical protein